MKKLFESWRSHLSSLDETMKDLKDVKAKYAEDPQMSKVIAKFEEIDPSGNHKYIRWMAKQAEMALKNNTFEEDIPYIVDSIKGFHKFSGNASVGKHMQKDINAYKDLARLVADVEEAKAQAEDAARKKEKGVKDRKQAKEDSALIHDDDKFMVLRPTSKHASCYYGRGTKWCISATEADNYFDRYTNEGKAFYFVIDKTRDNSDPLKKVAWVGNFEGNFEEWFDALDDAIPRGDAEFQFNETDATLGKDIIAKMEDHLKSNPLEASFQTRVEKLVYEADGRLRHISITPIFEEKGEEVYVSLSLYSKLSLPPLVSRVNVDLSHRAKVLVALDNVLSKELDMGFEYNGAPDIFHGPRFSKDYDVRFSIILNATTDIAEVEKYLDEVKTKIEDRLDLISWKLFVELVNKKVLPPNPNMKLGQQIKEEEGVWNWDHVNVSYDDRDGQIEYSIRISNDEYEALNPDQRGDMFLRDLIGDFAFKVAGVDLYLRDEDYFVDAGENSISLMVDSGSHRKESEAFQVMKYIEENPSSFKKFIRKAMKLEENLIKKGKLIKIRIRKA